MKSATKTNEIFWSQNTNWKNHFACEQSEKDFLKATRAMLDWFDASSLQFLIMSMIDSFPKEKAK